MKKRNSFQGFTLIEVLVALSIFALLSVFCVQGFLMVANMEQRDRENGSAEQSLHQLWSVLGQDLLHLRQRAIHDQLGVVSGAYIAGREPYLVEFTRGGLPSLPVSPGGMMRVGYRLSDEGELIRVTWPALDASQRDVVQERVLMTGVAELKFEQLNESNYFETIWPPLNAQGNTAQMMPRMIRVSLTTEDGLQMTRLMPGITQVVPTPKPGNGGPGGEGGPRGQRDGADANDDAGAGR